MNDRIQVIDCREHRIAWQHQSEAGPPHKYPSLDGNGSVAKHEGFEVFCFVQINGSVGARGGHKSHMNLTWREEFEDFPAAKAAAEKWLAAKAAAALKRRVMRGAKKAMAAGAGQ